MALTAVIYRGCLTLIVKVLSFSWWAIFTLNIVGFIMMGIDNRGMARIRLEKYVDQKSRERGLEIGIVQFSASGSNGSWCSLR